MLFLWYKHGNIEILNKTSNKTASKPLTRTLNGTINPKFPGMVTGTMTVKIL